MATLGSLLVQHQVVGVTQIERALQRQVIQGGDLATNLLELELVDEDVLANFVAHTLEMPVLARELLQKPAQEALSGVPWELVNKFRFLPLRLQPDSRLMVASSARLESDELDEALWRLGLRLETMFAHRFRVAMGLNRYYGIPIPPRLLSLARRFEADFEADVEPAFGPPPQAGEGGIFSIPPRGASTVEGSSETYPTASVVSAFPVIQIPERAAGTRQNDATIRFVERPAKPVAKAIPVSGPLAIGSYPPEVSTASSVEAKSRAAPAAVDFDEACRLLAGARERDEIFDVVAAFCRGVFEFSVLFVVQGRAAEGRLAVWDDRLKTDLEHLSVPLDQGGMFQTAFETRSFYLGPPGETSADDDALRALGRAGLANCAVLPVMLRHRVIVLIYGDRGEFAVEPESVSVMVRLNQVVAEAFERLLLERKYGSRREVQPDNKPSSALPDGSTEELSRPQATEAEHGWDGRYHVKASNAPLEENHGLVDRVAPYSNSRPPVPTRLSRPPIGRIQTRRPFQEQGAPVTGEEEDHEGTSPPEQAPVELSSRPGAPASTLPESFVSLGMPTVGAPSVSSCPTVIVEMREEIGRLVQRVLTTKRFDEAAAELLVGIGDDAIRALLPHFPGPLNYNRLQAAGLLPRVASHGPLLRTMLMFGKAAVPHLVPLLESVDPNQRFYATFLFSELPYPSALGALVARIFDNDQQIRALAMDVIRGFAQFPEYRWALGEVVAVLGNDLASPEAKRIAAVALGELREPSAVPALIECLGNEDGALAERCYRALMKVTFEDLGFARERWESWFDANRLRHRLEWAMDALGGRSDAQRKTAASELRKYTGSVVVWPSGLLDERQWAELRRQCRAWWKNEGWALYAYRSDS